MIIKITNTMFQKLFFIILISLIPVFAMAQKEAKPRVIAMTDGEIDDHSSMVRFLLYTCDIDLLAIIETNSVYQKKGHSKEDWLEKQLAAYEQVYPNLIKHNPSYPTAA
ncbi:MAG TPA: nucleoside hydrolase-like domain-containing protein, partial [Flavisolibacter sp.]